MLGEFLEGTFRRFRGTFGSWDDELDANPSCTASLDQAVELVVDETNRRIRAIPGYARRLRRPVATAFHYIDRMVEQVPGVLACGRASFGEDPHLNAFFVNHGHLQEVFSQSREVRDLFDSDPTLDECFALLCMKREEHRRLGVELVGDQLRKDVMQATVSFSGHQLVSPGVDESAARCALKCCIFKSLLSSMRNKTVNAKKRTVELENRRRALRGRLSRAGGRASGDVAAQDLEAQIDAVERELRDLEPRLVSLEDHLHFVVETLGHPESYLSADSSELFVDRMGVKRDGAASGSAFKLSLAEIKISQQQPRVAALVRFPREELLPNRDFLQQASLFLSDV